MPLFGKPYFVFGKNIIIKIKNKHVTNCSTIERSFIRRNNAIIGRSRYQTEQRETYFTFIGKGFPVEVLFLRDDDIPQSVANGVSDIGIVGENEYVEKGEKPAW